MYTINIRGKQNPKDTKMVKLEIIFFKTGYARVPKVINITGLLKDWDVKSQSFRVGSAEATTKNKLLFDLRTKYLHVADTWWKSHATLTLLATQDCPLWLQYD